MSRVSTCDQQFGLKVRKLLGFMVSDNVLATDTLDDVGSSLIQQLPVEFYCGPKSDSEAPGPAPPVRKPPRPDARHARKGFWLLSFPLLQHEIFSIYFFFFEKL